MHKNKMGLYLWRNQNAFSDMPGNCKRALPPLQNLLLHSDSTAIEKFEIS